MPASTFSETACSRKPAGAQTGTRPACTSSARDDALDAAEVVDVAVRVDDRAHLALAAVGAVQGERGGRALGGDEWVDHDHARLPSTKVTLERS